jgi:hypothetical protein
MYMELEERSMNEDINLIDQDDVQYDIERNQFIWKPKYDQEIIDYLDYHNHVNNLDEKIFISQFFNQRDY